MNKKKSRKRTKITPNKKLINLFLLIFLIAFLTTIASYFTMKNKEAVKDISAEVKIQEINKEPLIPKMAEIKDFKEQSSQEFFEEKFDIKEEHKFEEYTKELEKVIDEKTEMEDSINKENEIIQKKVEEIKEEKLKDKQKDKSTENTKESVILSVLISSPLKALEACIGKCIIWKDKLCAIFAESGCVFVGGKKAIFIL